MNEERREHLRSWYRQALVRRASVLETLVPAMVEDGSRAVDDVRTIARSLAGSGGTFGFPDVTEAARIVAGDGEDLLPRVVGLIDVLHQVAADGRARRDRAGRWLHFAVGPLPEPPEGGAVPPELSLEEAWERVAARLGVDPSILADRIATRLGIRMADPASAERSARMVVPPALALEYRVLPLLDDGIRIVAASANPTDVLAMAALERATGRRARLEVVGPRRLAPILRELYGSGGTDGPPDHGAPPLPLHRGAVPGESPGALTVLVVDDEPDDRLLCRTALERDGMKVLEAEDGEAALELLDGDTRVDAALVDVMMPGMDGGELLRAIRSHPVRAHLPVVVLTGLQATEDEVRLVEEGADDYLRKPVDPRVLVARIHASLRRSGATGTS